MAKKSIKTREQIMQVAERLLVEEGLDCSLRTIMKEADVNVAAINYHFGNRFNLIKEIVENHSAIINRERTELLDKALEKKRPVLREIVEAYTLPVYDFEHRKGASKYASTLVGRINSNADPTLRTITTNAFKETHTRFLNALRLALPDMSEKALYWRFLCIYSIIGQSMANPERVIELSNGVCDPKNVKDVKNILIPMMLSMLRTKHS